MSSVRFVGDVMTAFAQTFEPLEESLGSGESFSAFLADFGWLLDPASSINTITTAFGSLPNDLVSMGQAVIELEAASNANDVDAIAKAVEKLVTAIQDLVKTAQALSQINADTLWPSPLNSQTFWTVFPQELLEYLLYRYLERRAVKIFASLRFIGVLSEDFEAPPMAGRVPYVRRGVRWDRLVTAVSRPQDLFPEVYGWGKAFEAHRLLDNLQALAVAFGVPAGTHEASAKILDAYYDATAESRRDAYELAIPIFWTVTEAGSALAMISVELAALPIPPAGQKSLPAIGFALYPRVIGNAAASIPLTPSVSIQLKGGFVSEAAVRAELRPGSLNVYVDPTLSARVEATVAVEAKPAQPWILLGRKGASRLELAHAHTALKAQGEIPDIEFVVELAADAAAVVIDFGEGDGFLQKILGGSPQRVEMGLGLAWSSKKGLKFSGQAELEATIPIHQSIGGVIKLESVSIGFRASTTDPGISLGVGVSGGFELGPVAASVDRVGVQAKLAAIPKGQPPGNLGDANLTWAFLPPKGLGLVIDAAVVKGGGYLFFDPDKGEYAGVLELSIKDQIQIKAIGLLTTKLPDGKPGFSLLLIITAQFSAIQLAFGFTLTGIGGLAGINRTMLVDVLRAGLKSHSLGSIMFPENPVKNATKIISDLRSIFPPVEGRYVFGPMLELNWGTPALITAEIGVFIELPEPINLVILGIIKATLPEPKAPVVKIHMDVIGTIEFEKKRFAIDATLYDSEIVGFALTGDMAMRLLWGDRPNFALSVGGLNPRFAPPPEFPTLRRLQLSMGGDGSNPRLSLDTYFAITSNSVQVGAHLDVRAEAGGFVAHGYLGFDALFIFSPFSFIAEMAGGVDLLKGSSVLMCIHLDFTLSGPAPWHAFGHASFKILFFSVSVAFDEQWGEPTPAPLQPADAKAPLLAALVGVGSWSATLPADTERGASLAEAKAPQGVVLVHPFGRLQVQQKVVPLGETITRFGTAAPDKWNHFSVSAISLNGKSAPHQEVKDFFARGQFFELSDEEKLSKESFEKLTAGLAIGSDDITKGAESTVDVQYETYLVDDPVLPPRLAGRYQLNAETFLSQLRVGAGWLSPVRMSGEQKFSEPGVEGRIKLADLAHVIVTTDQLSVRGDLLDGDGASQVSAESRLARHLAKHPEDRGRLQVVPKHEVPV